PAQVCPEHPISYTALRAGFFRERCSCRGAHTRGEGCGSQDRGGAFESRASRCRGAGEASQGAAQEESGRDRIRRTGSQGRGGGGRMRDPFQVIERPLLTEKSMDLSHAGKYTFRVAKDANKI